MSCHTLAYHSLHSGKTDTVLVLEKLSDSSDTAVSEMIDIIFRSDTVFKSNIIVNRSEYIALCYMLRYKLVYVALYSLGKELSPVSALLEEFLEHREINPLMYSESLCIDIKPCFYVHHLIGEHLYKSGLRLDHDIFNTCILNVVSELCINPGALLCDELACKRIEYIFTENMASDTVS